MTKQFPLRVVLTVTTGRLLTEGKRPRDNGIGDLYEILNWMTGDNLFTHQLPRASDTCKPWLLKCFPELAGASEFVSTLAERIDQHGAVEGIKRWLVQLQMAFPNIKDEYDVEPLPEGWTTIDPMIELESMVGKDKIAVVRVAD
jgi:hypothetical protein